MRAIKAARRLIETDPSKPDAKILAGLSLALAGDEPFHLNELYALTPDSFELALEILREWQLDRFYMGKARLLDIAWQLEAMDAQQRPAAAAVRD